MDCSEIHIIWENIVPHKDPEARRAYQRSWYKQNPSGVKKGKAKKAKIIKEFVRAAKTNKPCKDCEVVYPYYVMDFDHREDKICHPSRIYMKGWSLEKVQKELDKCDLVCANCHRDRTHRRRNGIVV